MSNYVNPNRGGHGRGDGLKQNNRRNYNNVGDRGDSSSSRGRNQFRGNQRFQDAQPRRSKPQTEESRAYLEQLKREKIKNQREALPIFDQKNALLEMLAENQVLIVFGETGSGKTTQIPQYLAEAKYTASGCIGCTQPRRVAASTVADRVSLEYGCKLGDEVGYAIRFENITSAKTVVKYMTDGILLNECLKDPDLLGYSVIMLDEAHERTINTDVLCGLLKGAVSRRKNLKLIVSSATMDQQKFSAFFDGARVLPITGRLHPVEIIHSCSSDNYLEAAKRKVMEIHMRENTGDILVFLTGQEDIEKLCDTLSDGVMECGSLVSKLIVMPLYSALEPEDQKRVFEPTPSGARKVVVATNIAESSLTIDGIVYVVDSGFVKQRIHHPKSGMDTLETILISQAQAVQRAGRAGRTAPGKCFRLYSEAEFSKMSMLFVPEIQRSNLASVVLRLKTIGIDDVVNFPFMDPPPHDAITGAIYHLILIGALNDEGKITDLGKRMSEFPLDPCFSKYLIFSSEMGCSDEVLSIVSLYSVQNIHTLFRRPPGKKALAINKHSTFFKPEGDHLTLLAIYNAWKDNHHDEDWCWRNYISIDVLRKAQEIRGQLLFLMDREKLPIVSCSDVEVIQKTICASFFYNAAHRQETCNYKVLKDGELAWIRRNDALYSDRPQWVVFNELLRTGNSYMQQVTKIEPQWLNELAPRFFTLNHFSSTPVFATNRFNELRLVTDANMRLNI